MIELTGLTRRRGRVRVVDDLTCTIRPGRVTGLLGPNGAGKSSTMRMIVGLDRPTSGEATVQGRPYHALREPLRTVGAQLDPAEARSGLTAHAHLRALAATHRIPRRRIDTVLGIVGLDGVAGRRVHTFSLGMTQRLAVAAALLGDPPVLLFDEPVNGLDPDGVRWLRGFLRGLADSGRTVLLSSHLIRELEDTADHVVVLGRGRLLADAPVHELVAGSGSLEAAYLALTGGAVDHRAGHHPERWEYR
ncbi:MAG: ATP-binding cassette domain-containing protein [Pseudonocardia sp.]|nr:ATP-binding cassette domain-containing protein [Pseudonocardia sp.]